MSRTEPFLRTLLRRDQDSQKIEVLSCLQFQLRYFAELAHLKTLLLHRIIMAEAKEDSPSSPSGGESKLDARKDVLQQGLCLV